MFTRFKVPEDICINQTTLFKIYITRVRMLYLSRYPLCTSTISFRATRSNVIDYTWCFAFFFFFFFFFLISKSYQLEGTFTGQKKKKKNEKNDTRNENVINHRILRTYGKNGCSLLAGRVSFLPTRYLVDIALSVEMGTQQPTERILTLCVSSSVSLIARSRFATLCTRTIPIVPFVPSSGNYRRGEGGGGGCF